MHLPMIRKIFAAGAASLLLAGCGIPKIQGKLVSKQTGVEMPDVVGVLPPENRSNDMTAVEVIQRAGGAALVSRGYYVIANKAQDQALQKMGITDGGQLGAYRPQEICKNLGTEGLLYSTVEDFNEINIGFWQSKKVKIGLRLSDCSGQNLWEGEGLYRIRVLTINPQAAAQAFAQRMVGQLIEKALKVHLVPESQQAAMKLGEKITPWPKDRR